MVRTMNLQQRQQRISSMHGCPRGPRVPDQVGQPEFWPEPSRPGQGTEVRARNNTRQPAGQRTTSARTSSQSSTNIRLTVFHSHDPLCCGDGVLWLQSAGVYTHKHTNTRTRTRTHIDRFGRREKVRKSEETCCLQNCHCSCSNLDTSGGLSWI